MSDSLNNKELVAVGHQFAKAMSSDTLIIDMAKMFTRLAERLDCTTAVLREMTKQRDASVQAERAWETAMMQACGEDGPKSVADKFTELEAKCSALAAENAALKDGVTYFAYSPEYGFDYFANKQAAIDTAQEEIDAYREDADDGWSEDVQRVSWGIVMQQAQGFDAQGIHTSDNQHTYQTCDYRLVDAVQTPATDAFLAEMRASAVEEFVRMADYYESVVEGEIVVTPNSVFAAGHEFAAQLRQGGVA